jgi:hypothetical protein
MVQNNNNAVCTRGTRGSRVGWDYASKRKVAGSIPDEVVEFFFFLKEIWRQLWLP